MLPFPVESLRPTGAVLRPHPLKGLSIEVLLEPFVLHDPDAEQDVTVESSVLLDMIDGLSTDLAKLEGRTFSFPVNPQEGYIDGSVYLFGAHHPVDVTEVAFGDRQGEALPVTFTMTWALEFEASGYQNTPVVLTTLLVPEDA